MTSEEPHAEEEWTTKALLLGAELHIDTSIWGVLWVATAPDGKEFYGVTQARACRKLVRSFIGSGP